MRTLKLKFPGALAAGLMFFLMPLMVAGQEQKNSLTGKYEGTAKDSTGEAKVTLELVDESGKFSGSSTTSHGTLKLIKGQLVDGLLTLEFETTGPPHKLSLRQKDGKLIGTVIDGTKTAEIEFQRMVADEISGEWDAAADAQGQPFPFTLSLKLDGEKVTGTSDSQLGHSTISTGVWKDGKLAVILESANGQVALTAALTDGKLVGDYDFAGQLSGKWVAVKRKP